MLRQPSRPRNSPSSFKKEHHHVIYLKDAPAPGRPRYLNHRQINISNQEGLHFQDHITLFDRKSHILGGGRYDWFWQGQARGSSGDLAESYIYSKPVSINPLLVGNPFAAGNLQYNFFALTRSDTAFSQRVGVSFLPVPNRQSDDLSAFQLPGYVRLDAMASYSWDLMGDKWTAPLNLRNLANARYYESADNNFFTPRYSIYPGAPFTAMGTIRVAF